jgi:HNH endonuclease
MQRDIELVLRDNSHSIPTGCMLWTGFHNRYGYGIVKRGGKNFRVHRLAWEFFNKRPIPEGYCICHSCDTRDCINPEHFFLGTKADNNRDRWGKGRMGNILRGEKHQNSKVTWKNVRAIRKSKDSQRSLAKKYGISKTEIGRIKRMEYWITDAKEGE